MGVDQSQFTLATAEKEEQKMLELQSKYERVLEAYNQEVKRRTELENKMLKGTSRPRIAYPPRPPIEPFKSTPIVDILDTPERPQFYSAEDFEEEKSKLYALHVELNNQYKEKLRLGVMYMVDRVERSSFFDLLARMQLPGMR